MNEHVETTKEQDARSAGRTACVCVAVAVTLSASLACAALLAGVVEPFDGVRFVVWHGLAVLSTTVAARALGPMPFEDVLAVVATAAFLPLFGPPLAWSFVWFEGRDAKNAHVGFEEEEAERKENYVRSGLTGEYEVDLARETSAVSYAQILRQGTLQRRRNLLRSLARIGSPQHVEIIRRCLYDEEPELRLCAHAELDKLARKHEQSISALREKMSSDEDDGSASLPGQIARACREYAASGIFDEEMCEFWMMQAERYASKARERAPEEPTWVRLHAEILVEVGQFEAATDVLDSIDVGNENLATALVRAEIAFVDRDLDRLREISDEFERQFVPVPAWIASILGRRPPRPGNELPQGLKEVVP